MYKRKLSEWVEQMNNKCWELIGLSPTILPHFFFQKYNSKTNIFIIGLKTTSDLQSKNTKKWCATNINIDKYPRFLNCQTWKLNNRYIILKFRIFSNDVNIPKPEKISK